MTRFLLLLCATVMVADAQFMPTPSTADLELATRAMHFRSIGPHRGGRSLAVAGHPDLKQTYYAGATGGGVWKTENGGRTWTCVSDTTFTSSSVGAITIAPSDANVVYVGMGETDIRGNISVGDGMYRTTDGGHTWAHIGLRECRMIADIVVHPDDPDVVFVSSMGHVFGPNPDRGIFKTTDGGRTWRKVLYRNDSTGGLTLKMDPNNPRILFASLWQAHRTPWSMSSGGSGSGLYKSTDGGETWKDISKNPGLPRGLLGKICVDVSRARRNLVWAMIENKAGGGLFRSDDAGTTWRRVSDDPDIRTRPWYFSHVYADPIDADRVYVLNVSMRRSDNGGTSWTNINTGHGDHHDMWIDPTDAQRFIVADDGGFEVTENGGRTFTDLDLPTCQFYHVSVDTAFPYRLYGAQQDNTTLTVASRTTGWSIGREDWWRVAGFESGHVLAKPTDPNITYGGNYSGYIGRYDKRTDQEQNISVLVDNPIGGGAKDVSDRFQWTFPIVISPHDPNTIYATSQYVYRTTDEGMSWTRLSGDLTRNDTTKQGPSGGPITKDNTGVETYCTIFAFDESPVRKGILWTGSDDGLVHVSTDNGTTWKNVTPSDLASWSRVSSVATSPHDAATCYVAVNRYQMNDLAPIIYRTTDYGATWTKIVTGIPAGAFARIVREDPFRKGLLYAGTEIGLFLSFDQGATWSRLRRDLPTTPIHDLVVHPREKDLVVGTHGRGFYILDDLTPLHQYDDAARKASVHLLAPRHTWRMEGGSWSSADMEVGENAPNGVLVHYLLSDTTSKELRLTFVAPNGDSIMTFSSNVDVKGEPFKSDTTYYRDSLHRPSPQALTRFKGLNRFVWNMTYPGSTDVPGQVLWAGTTQGPRAVPGTYTVRLQMGDVVQTQRVEIRKDPRVASTVADLQQQFDAHRRLNAMLTTVHDDVLRIRELRAEIGAAKGLLRDADTTAKKTVDSLAKTALDTLQGIEDECIQHRIKAFQDALNHPVKLNNKIAALIGVVASADTRPTKQALDFADELQRRVDAQHARLERVEREHVRGINEAITRLGVPVILPRKAKP
jgi:photosystem II stability/assembly factor-like uncharacterized protein